MRVDSVTYEWAVFLRRLPTQPYRGGMSEQEVVDFVDEWADAGGWPESFYIARRPVGPWEFMSGDEPFGAPTSLVTAWHRLGQ